jgi:cell division protein FtsI/penicillin-binding protein 2
LASPRLRRTTALLAVALLLLTGCGLFGDDRAERARAAGAAFLTDWQAGRAAQAAARTSDPKAAEQTLRELIGGLRVATAELTARDIEGCQDAACVLPFEVRLELAALGTWRYSSSLTLTEQGDRWQVAWAPSVVHPKLTTDTRLRRVRELPERAPILDRDGRPLVAARPVVTVGVEPRRLTGGLQAIATVARALDVDAAALSRRVRGARPDAFVEVLTLREQEYDAVAARLRGIGGVVTRPGTLPLAPTRSFARAVLGAVTPATKETLQLAGPTASAADRVGSSGLQAAFQRQLAGAAGGRVDLVDRATGAVRETLTEFAARPGTPVRTTLSYGVQDAAERALATTRQTASLVAIDTRTGGILAAANGPEPQAAENRALAGRYPPGSTFKVVTTTALLRDGLKPAQSVPCPGTVNVGGRRFENFDGLGALGSVPFHRAFTESCNTAFLALARDLPPAALPDAAASYGIGADWQLPVPSYSGSVPASADVVERAANAIGQGKVLVSPLAMAVVAATVTAGAARPPSLVLDTAGTATPGTNGAGAPARATAAPTAPAPAAAAPAVLREAATLRGLMQQTVRSGTARVLALPGEPVGAKTGTAEYGTQRPPRKHAWMIGFRGDVAFAVLVENADTGAKSAGPVARAFLQHLR